MDEDPIEMLIRSMIINACMDRSSDTEKDEERKDLLLRGANALREMQQAIDAAETEHGLTSNGNMWRFWAKMANSFGDDYRKEKIRADAAEKMLKEIERVLTDTLAHLTAAVSLLERGGKKAAASDKMFDQMLLDYKASIDRARTHLARHGAKG